ncbi:hypothetical protein [Archaeoglobus neptunius]|uniref:hypothetical protein n=1 Tax=Archaeoglobus neptunius TaxID=2798580 RepID=UPI0019285ED9|nr:hypothetical protein [Archaeoglobus neptunius]
MASEVKAEKIISPYDLLPEQEANNLMLIFNVLMKNKWRLGRFDKKWFFKFKKYGIRTYKDKEKLAHLLYKYRKQIEEIVRKMDKTDLDILTKAGFFDLMEKLEKGEQITETEINIPEFIGDKKEIFDEKLQYSYENATFFPRNLNDWYWEYYNYALGDILTKIALGELKPSAALVDAMEKVKRALYEYIYIWAIETIKYPSPIVVGFSKYPFHQAQKSADRKLRAMENFARSLKHLDKVLENEGVRAKGIKDLELKFSKVKEIKQVKVDRVEIKGFMYPSGVEHIRVFFHFTFNGKPHVIEEIFKGQSYAVHKLNGLLKLKHYLFDVGEEIIQLEWDVPEVKRWEMFFFNNWYNLGFYVGVNKGNIVRKRLYFNKVTGLSGWMDEDEKPSKDNWIACRVDTYFNWAKEVIGKLNKDLRDLEKLVKKKWESDKIYYLDHLSEIRREVKLKLEDKAAETAAEIAEKEEDVSAEKLEKITEIVLKHMNEGVETVDRLKSWVTNKIYFPDEKKLEEIIREIIKEHENGLNKLKVLRIEMGNIKGFEDAYTFLPVPSDEEIYRAAMKAYNLDKIAEREQVRISLIENELRDKYDPKVITAKLEDMASRGLVDSHMLFKGRILFLKEYKPKAEEKAEKKTKAKKKNKAKTKVKKASRVMNKGLQIANLKKFLKKHGIDPDLVDLEALVDSTLTYRENKENIMKQLGISEGFTVKPSEIERQEIEDAIRQVQMYHEMRSERAQQMDERKVAKIPKDPEAWFRHPERYDLPEVDYPDPNYTVEDYLKDIKQKKRKRRKSKSK